MASQRGAEPTASGREIRVARAALRERTVDVSVVIPAFNEEESIVGCLAALRAQTIPPLEILVVDNLSTDSTVATVESTRRVGFAPQVLFQTHAQGLIPTRNFGFDQARGDVIARIDADTIVSCDWVEQVTRLFASPSVSAATGPVGYYDLPMTRLTRRLDDLTRRTLLVAGRNESFLFGCNMAITREAWRCVRADACRDADDRFHEDIDLALHLAEHGLRIAYEPRMTATISARSAGRTEAEFHDYTRRFERTLDAHGVSRTPLRVVGALLRFAYPVLHRVRTSPRAAQP